MKTKVLRLDAADAGEIELKDSIFGLEPRADLIQRVVVWQLAQSPLVGWFLSNAVGRESPAVEAVLATMPR